MQSWWFSSPGGSHGWFYILLATMRDNNQSLDNRGSSPKPLVSTVFIRAHPYRWLLASNLPQSFSIPLVSSSSGGQNWYGVPQSPTINGTVRLSSHQSPKTKTFLSGKRFQGPRSLPTSEGQRPELSLGKLNSLLYSHAYYTKVPWQR